jgi:pimeloyl-ACP methyl ester carboxylesterase
MQTNHSPYKSGMIPVNGIDLAYHAFGWRTDPAFLLIMGLGTQMVAWDDAFCSQLMGRGYYVIRFDNRDVGLSGRPANAGVPDLAALEQRLTAGHLERPPYTLDDMATDGIGLLKGLGIQQAHVAGVSMGGMIAQVMASDFPQHVRSLTSIMSSTGRTDLPPPTPEALEVLLTPYPADREGYIESFVRTYRIISGPVYPINETRVRRWAQMHFENGLNPDGITRQLAAILYAGDRTEALRRITAPTLVLHGDADPLFSVTCAHATADAIPGARLEIIPGMGHVIPDALWDFVVDLMVAHAS